MLDLSLVPIQDLPLQTILTFQPCSTPVAVSYLQGLCCAEGYLVERRSLLQLYESTYELSSIDLPDNPALPGSGYLPVPDLRRAIHNLQLWCPTNETHTQVGYTRQYKELHQDPFEELANWVCSTSGGDCPAEGLRENKGLTREWGTHRSHQHSASYAELTSFVDSHLIRGPDTLEVL